MKYFEFKEPYYALVKAKNYARAELIYSERFKLLLEEITYKKVEKNYAYEEYTNTISYHKNDNDIQDVFFIEKDEILIAQSSLV